MKIAGLFLGLVLFLVLATANSGGYRYGISDQAFYVPAASQQLEPDLFPRDAALLRSQSRLMASDDLIVGVVRATGASLPQVTAALYVITLIVMIAAAGAFARGLGYSWWAVGVFGLLLTFRHRIAKTGANSLEGYMHPRQLAFGAGIAALACVVRGRHGLALVLVGLAGVVHPTTALFFGIVVLLSAWVSQPHWRRWLAGAAAVGAVAAVWAVTAGPLAGRLVGMDPRWLEVLATKDYLFPSDWPLDAWALNLAYPAVIYAVWHARLNRGLVTPHETGLVFGAFALLVVFFATVPLTMAKVALAVQLQVTRVFWVLDLLAIAGVAWWLAERKRVAVIAITVLALASAGRGYYLLHVAQPARSLVTVDLPDTPWVEAMRWLDTQPRDWLVLADPDHAWKHGFSVRVAARRDTVLEAVKDSAIALYDRRVATRVRERVAATRDYESLTTDRARALGARYGLDVVVVQSAHPLDLPVLYQNAEFIIYDVR